MLTGSVSSFPLVVLVMRRLTDAGPVNRLRSAVRVTAVCWSAAVVPLVGLTVNQLAVLILVIVHEAVPPEPVLKI